MFNFISEQGSYVPLMPHLWPLMGNLFIFQFWWQKKRLGGSQLGTVFQIAHMHVQSIDSCTKWSTWDKKYPPQHTPVCRSIGNILYCRHQFGPHVQPPFIMSQWGRGLRPPRSENVGTFSSVGNIRGAYFRKRWPWHHNARLVMVKQNKSMLPAFIRNTLL